MNDKINAPIICPNCRKLILKNEAKCPYCGLIMPGSWIGKIFSLKTINDPELPLRFIIYANLFMYVISILINTRWPGTDLNYFTFLSPENQSLLFLGATGKIPIDAYSRWWTLISANYLHGNLLHIFFNLIALKQLGVLATREYGPFRTIIIYSISGMAGYWISYFAGVNFTVGASAAICGLMGAMIFYGKKRGGMYGRIIYKQIGVWAIGMFLFGMLVPNINNWGHGGGLVAGALLGFILKFNEESVENRNHRLLGMGCLAVTFITLVWAVITGIYMRIIS